MTLATPLLDVTSAATTLDSSLTRERSSGYRNDTVSGAAFS